MSVMQLSGRMIVRLAVIAWAITLLFEIGLIGFGYANAVGDPLQHGSTANLLSSAAAAILVFQSMATIGVLIVRRDPQNRVGWLFCAAPLLMMAGNFFSTYGEYALNTNPGGLPAGVYAAQLNWLWIYGMTLFASFVVLLFPDGRLLTRRWRPVAWLGGVSLTCLWIGVMLAPGHIDPPLERFRNPIGIDGAQYLLAAGLLVPVVMVLGIVSGVLRYRRGGHVQRLQIRWFLTAVIAFAVCVVGSAVLSAAAGIETPDWVFLLLLLMVPASVGVAILRYRLYEIDVLIRKTLVYAGLVAALAVVYLAGISVLGWAFRSVTGQSGALAVTLSTLAVAAAFQPLRGRIQRAVDHRFYRRTYDAAQILDAFTGKLREEIELDNLHGEVLVAVHATVQPRHASLWLRPKDG